MANRGIAVVVVLGVDIAILGVDIAILGVDIATLGVDIAIIRVATAILGVNIAILRRQKRRGGGGGGYRGREEGKVSHVRCPEAGWSVRELMDNRSHKVRGGPCYKPIPGVRSGRGLDCRRIL